MSNKLKKAGSKTEKPAVEIVRDIAEYMIAIVAIAIGVIVPFYLKDRYYGVGDCKYEAYEWCVRIGFAAMIIVVVIYWFMAGKDSVFNNVKTTDLFVGAFVLLAFIAAIAGGNFSECISGYKGWFMGILSLLSFALLYFFNSFFQRYYRTVLAVLCIVAFITFILGILNRMLIDPIGVYTDIDDKYKNQFLSTLGQATWYSSYMAVLLPIGAGVFMSSDRKSRPFIFYTSLIYCIIGFMTAVSQNSDSAYFALIGMFMVLFAFGIRDAKRISAFFRLIFVFFVSTRLMYLLLLIHPNPILKLDSISNFIIFSPIMWLITASVGFLWGAVYYYNVKEEKYSDRLWKMLFNIILCVVAAAFVLWFVILIADAKGVLPAGISALTSKIPYLDWSENWGNGRGRTWAFSLMMFKDMGFINKLFGVGPDGYAPYAYNLYAERLGEMWGERTLTNAHNEILNSLISYGIFGVIAYIGIFVSTVKELLKKWDEYPYLSGFIAAIAAYLCHNFFCYQQVCCTPFIFIVMGCGIYVIRNTEDKTEK